MKNWCKHFFGSFFINRFATDDLTSGIMNTLLAFFIAFFLLIISLFGGFMLSFGAMYDNSEDFKRTTDRVVADIKDLKIENGKAVTGTIINTFDVSGDEKYKQDGYSVIVDTRRMETTFVEFTPFYINTKDSRDKLTFEEYSDLSDTVKKQYSFKVDLTDNVIDTIAGIINYEEYFKNVGEENKKNYNELQELKPQLSEKEYADNLYVLYTVNKYPDIVNADSYSYAPTLRTYYLNKITSSSANRYFILFDNGIFCCFETSNGVLVDFAGNLSGLSDINFNGISAADLIKEAFNGSSSFNFNFYFVNSFNVIGFMVLCYAVCVLVSFAVCRLANIQFGLQLSGNIAAVGACVLFSGIFSGVICIGLSFAVNRYVVLNLAPFIFGAILLIRTIVLLVCEYIKQNKEIDRTQSMEDGIF